MIADVSGAGINPSIGWQVLLVLGFVITLSLQVVQLVRPNKSRLIEPQPLVVQAAADYVRREVFETAVAQIREELNGARATIVTMETELRREVKDDVGALYEKINSVGREVSALTAATLSQNQTLTQISAKLDRVAERGMHV